MYCSRCRTPKPPRLTDAYSVGPEQTASRYIRPLLSGIEPDHALANYFSVKASGCVHLYPVTFPEGIEDKKLKTGLFYGYLRKRFGEDPPPAELVFNGSIAMTPVFIKNLAGTAEVVNRRPNDKRGSQLCSVTITVTYKGFEDLSKDLTDLSQLPIREQLFNGK